MGPQNRVSGLGRSAAPSDHELLQAIGRSSEEAFETLFQRWAPSLFRFLHRATGSPEAGEDLLQEAFLRVLQGAPRYEPRGAAGAWLYRICANLAYSFWRRERHAPRATDPLALAEDRGRATWRTPETDRLETALTRELGSALGRIPANQRMAFLLKVNQGLSYEEMAAVLQCPVGTAKSRFHHAVLKLREELQEWQTGSALRGVESAAGSWIERPQAGRAHPPGASPRQGGSPSCRVTQTGKP